MDFLFSLFFVVVVVVVVAVVLFVFLRLPNVYFLTNWARNRVENARVFVVVLIAVWAFKRKIHSYR